MLVAAFALCQSAAADQIRVAVATNFTAPMTALAERFAEQGDHTVLVSYGSTGNHYAQIANGAPFELFFAADVERPRLLEDQGLAVPGSRFSYARGRIALWSPTPGYVDADGRILDTGDFRHLAIATPELAPYGAAARDVLVARGVWERLQRKLVQGQDIGQTFSFVYTGNAELGFVAYSQLAGPDRKVAGSYWLVPEALHAPIEQQAVMIRDGAAARGFLQFMKSQQARSIIRDFGYEN